VNVSSKNPNLILTHLIMLIFMGIRKGLQKLKGDKDKNQPQNSGPSQASSLKPLPLAGTQEKAHRSTESVNEDGTPKEVKRA
jgi:hypothetical protein